MSDLLPSIHELNTTLGDLNKNVSDVSRKFDTMASHNNKPQSTFNVEEKLREIGNIFQKISELEAARHKQVKLFLSGILIIVSITCIIVSIRR